MRQPLGPTVNKIRSFPNNQQINIHTATTSIHLDWDKQLSFWVNSWKVCLICCIIKIISFETLISSFMNFVNLLKVIPRWYLMFLELDNINVSCFCVPWWDIKWLFYDWKYPSYYLLTHILDRDHKLYCLRIKYFPLWLIWQIFLQVGTFSAFNLILFEG